MDTTFVKMPKSEQESTQFEHCRDKKSSVSVSIENEKDKANNDQQLQQVL